MHCRRASSWAHFAGTQRAGGSNEEHGSSSPIGGGPKSVEVRRAKKFLGAGARFATSNTSQKMPLLREGWLLFSRSRPLSLGIVDQAPHAARIEMRAGAWGANTYIYLKMFTLREQDE